MLDLRLWLFESLRRALIDGYLELLAMSGEGEVPLGRILIIFCMSSSKPISRIRSASSMIKDFKFRKTKPLVF